MNNCGVYLIQHTESGKKYIGQSRNIKKRWYQHINDNTPSKISRAIKKHGKDSFEFSIIELCAPNQLDEIERYYILKYDSVRNGYNILMGGSSEATPETVKTKISKSQKRRYKKRDYNNIYIKILLYFPTQYTMIKK